MFPYSLSPSRFPGHFPSRMLRNTAALVAHTFLLPSCPLATRALQLQGIRREDIHFLIRLSQAGLN